MRLTPGTEHVVKVLQSLYWAAAIVSDPSSGTLFVASSFTGQVTAVDPNSGQLLWNASVGKSPFAVIYDPVDGLLYVLEVNGKSRMLVVLNALTGQPVTTVNVGPSPTSLAAIGNKTFVTNGAQTTVTVVSFTPSPLKRVTSTTVATASTSPTVSTTQYSTPPVHTGVPTAPPSPFSVIPLTDIVIVVVIVIIAGVALIVIRTRFLGR